MQVCLDISCACENISMAWQQASLTWKIDQLYRQGCFSFPGLPRCLSADVRLSTCPCAGSWVELDWRANVEFQARGQDKMFCIAHTAVCRCAGIPASKLLQTHIGC